MQNKTLISGKIDITPLLAAFDQFQKGLKIAKTDLEKFGVIQYFSFTYELSWKTLRRILKSLGKDLHSPRVIFREAALDRLIDSPELWFEFLENRNNTAYAYNRTVAEQIFQSFPRFEEEMILLLSRIKNLK